MKNKLKFLIQIFCIYIFLTNIISANEIFNFDVTEIEIRENGKKFIGKKGGTATSSDGTKITATNFDYDKIKNILIAYGNVVVDDKKNQTIIYSNKITYIKNNELVFTEGNSKVLGEDVIMIADKFKYDKISNNLYASGKVKIENNKENYLIFSDNVTYNKNIGLFITQKNSKAINEGITITADNFKYDKIRDILNANGKVFIEDKIENYTISANDITFNKKLNKIYTKGKTDAEIQSKYSFLSSDVKIDRNLKQIKSDQNSTLTDDNFNLYKLTDFIYFYEKKFLKGKNIEVETNSQSEKKDKFFFSDGFLNFSENTFISKDTKVNLNKKLFDKERELQEDQKNIFLSQNDPRIYSVSSKGNEDKVVLNKAIFTSCKNNNNCPAWSIKADKITHDRVNRNIHYNNAVLNIYDMPVFYFPKFFHPDPSVDRRSGLLQPRLNNSNVLGSSLNLPYFNVISDNKDMTFKPTIFDNKIYMLQNEYRQENKNSSFLADFSYTKGYQSSVAGDGNRNSISHFFSKFDLDLDLKNFKTSKLNVFLEKINNDTYLKVFENVLFFDEKLEKDLEDKNNLTSGIELALDNDDYNFTTGLTIYENLQEKNNDRYQYVMPFYDFSTSLFSNENGGLNFKTKGRNSLKDTNNLRSTITNSLDYSTKDLYSKKGFVNNFGVYFKNLNVTGKNDSKYKSSIQSELLNIYEINSKLPLIKYSDNTTDYITPKISFRINPSDMKDYSSDNRLITTDNIFDINRLGISDSYESGKSLTFGFDYKKENKENEEEFLEVKLATVLRDNKEDKIPASSSINRTTSNLFGSIENSFSEFLSLNYDFAIDNDFNKFEYNSIEAEFSVNNFVTTFNFLEKAGEIGDVNTLENTTKITIDDNNNLLFKTRRNRKISLTEYYDLVYEYQNDCLTAGVKYRKTYYQDRDLKPKEDLFFTITLFPLTSLDQKIDQSLYRN